MGYGIFAALYDELGDVEFRRGFGSLYLKINNLEHDAKCSGVDRGICYLREAFIEDASPGNFTDTASEVIERWYYQMGTSEGLVILCPTLVVDHPPAAW